ncbi:MAG: Small ribosomal subunit biogenesis GTPase RsgA [Luteibacter sp.]|uniref:ribosome small subunit-dependent GTPase A n=1 Tax=Luteibacter sp. TaxID=1886636 RepID=UPI001383D68D|nr:ribosome small subunit-dependent GTPase A [Luteibacter sp.]KAF1005833.1 MAG: Small ribosomal subunit biogenesis GTPase RsgA [Luteibacter sp.]
MSFHGYSLDQLDWRPDYARSLTLEDFEAGFPARVVAVHRSGVVTLSARGAIPVVVPPSVHAEASLAVGDWVLVEHDADRVLRLVPRQGLIERIAAGGDHRRQAIAANLDTLFVVTSCNTDFNASRLERYLALAFDVGVEPVVVLTRADLCEDVATYVDAVIAVSPHVAVVALDATAPAAAERLAPWMGAGRTVAFVGSSGVGKSTLTNRLIDGAQLTGGIREDDARGRHTTTAREMFPVPGGAWVIDTPGMRELRLAAAAPLEAVFDDVETIAAGCRFRDCRHEGDNGCAVRQALDDGRLDERRFTNYRKLRRESEEAGRSEWERRERSRQFGSQAKQVMQDKRNRQGR